ncbi:MAG: hypothetical protein WBD07_04980 [Vicinamibacterales bacterium]
MSSTAAAVGGGAPPAASLQVRVVTGLATSAAINTTATHAFTTLPPSDFIILVSVVRIPDTRSTADRAMLKYQPPSHAQYKPRLRRR